MIKKTLITTAVAASAKPGDASDWNPQPIECGPGMILVGDTCARTVLPPDPTDDSGAFLTLAVAYLAGALVL